MSLLSDQDSEISSGTFHQLWTKFFVCIFLEGETAPLLKPLWDEISDRIKKTKTAVGTSNKWVNTALYPAIQSALKETAEMKDAKVDKYSIMSVFKKPFESGIICMQSTWILHESDIDSTWICMKSTQFHINPHMHVLTICTVPQQLQLDFYSKCVLHADPDKYLFCSTALILYQRQTKFEKNSFNGTYCNDLCHCQLYQRDS